MSRYCGKAMPLLVPLSLRKLPGLTHRFGGDAEAQAGIDREVEAPLSSACRLDPRRLAELDHVGEQGFSTSLPIRSSSASLSGDSTKIDVGARLLVRLARRSASSRPVRRARVGAGDDQGCLVAPRLDGDLDLQHHVLGAARPGGRACGRTSWASPGPRSGSPRRPPLFTWVWRRRRIAAAAQG